MKKTSMTRNIARGRDNGSPARPFNETLPGKAGERERSSPFQEKRIGSRSPSISCLKRRGTAGVDVSKHFFSIDGETGFADTVSGKGVRFTPRNQKT
jgi:hypothetical protein